MDSEYENEILSEADHTVLESYKNLVDGLTEYLGSGYEIVLHSLEQLDRSVIKIVNGQYTGRTEGAPITNLALTMLKKITEGGNNCYISYRAKNKNGEPLKATTILIKGEGGRVIGLLCINLYLNTPLSKLLENLSPESLSLESTVSENYAGNTAEMLQRSIEEANVIVGANASILPVNRNKEIIALLNDWGIFKIKDSVSIVAQNMGISKNTVYLHLRHAKDK